MQALYKACAARRVSWFTTLLIGDNIIFFPLSELILGNIVAVWAVVPFPDGNREVVTNSVYSPGELEIPTSKVRGLVQYCKFRRLDRLLGGDDNAHHTV